MVFYKDLNERFISENPANTVSGSTRAVPLSSCRLGAVLQLAMGGASPCPALPSFPGCPEQCGRRGG